MTFGAQLLDHSTVRHRGVGLCKIAIERGEHQAFQQLLQLQRSLFPIELASNAEQMLFEKRYLIA